MIRKFNCMIHLLNSSQQYLYNAIHINIKTNTLITITGSNLFHQTSHTMGPCGKKQYFKKYGYM